MTDNKLLEWGPVSLIRRNHGLEHATLNLLAKELPSRAFAGHSDQKGFWIIGDVSTDKLLETVQEALQRMNSGEKSLALHANCGTNYVTAGVITGTLAWLATLVGGNTFKKKLDRWPLLMMIATGSLVAAQPLGPKVQAKISTSGEPGNLKVRQIVRYERQGPTLHRILTADVAPEPVITTESLES
jgi:frataxin-like iron-binding protein CyaY